MTLRIRHGDEPCDGRFDCTGWPLASPPMPWCSHALRRADGVEVGPEVGGDGVVGEVGHHARLLAVLDLPERVAAELAVVALLIDAEAARAVDQHAVLDVGDHLIDRRRPGGPGSIWMFGIRRNG